ncbi:MAG: UbiA family prenyltransferase [Firmicutes bacterium]|nr:UbiA family prenyltransferase [Bacillota bacterium]
MKTFKTFLSFIEIKTKTASQIPFFTALAYTFYHLRTVNVRDTALFWAAMSLFDMAVTCINNYMDTREAKTPGHFSRGVMLGIIFGFTVPAAALGIWLSAIHGLVFLLGGLLCFAVGIGYTYGPAPISKSPYGELCSGLVQGFLIPFLVYTLSAEKPLAALSVDTAAWTAAASLDLRGLLFFVLAMFPLAGCISNIMLANNTSDIEADRGTRYTLPMHIGKKNAVRLFTWIYTAAYGAVILAVILGALPWICLLVLLTLVPVVRNIRRFREKQVKAETFDASIHNFVILSLALAVCIFIGIFI